MVNAFKPEFADLFGEKMVVNEIMLGAYSGFFEVESSACVMNIPFIGD